mgnify:CR=1 FL=1
MPDSNARSSIADTFTKLLRLNLAGGPPLVTHEQLMAESEAHIARAARKSASPEQQIATQILANPTDYRAWEAEHERLMAAVARPNRSAVQARALLSWISGDDDSGSVSTPRESGRSRWRRNSPVSRHHG